MGWFHVLELCFKMGKYSCSKAHKTIAEGTASVMFFFRI